MPSRLRYRAALVATLLKPRHRSFRVRIVAGEQRAWRTLIAAIASNRTFGGGIPVVPRADICDGRLTDVFADDVSYPRFLATLAKVLLGAHEGDRRLHVVECESAEIKSDETVIVCADGEIVGRLPVRCTIMPGTLQVLRQR